MAVTRWRQYLITSVRNSRERLTLSQSGVTPTEVSRRFMPHLPDLRQQKIVGAKVTDTSEGAGRLRRTESLNPPSSSEASAKCSEASKHQTLHPGSAIIDERCDQPINLARVISQ